MKGKFSLHKPFERDPLIVRIGGLGAILIVFSTYTFYALCAITGNKYTGSDSSPAYYIFIGLLLAIALIAVLNDWFLSRRKYSNLYWIGLMLLALIGVDLVFNSENHGSYNFILYYCGFSIPAFVLGGLSTRRDVQRTIMRYIDAYSVFLTLAVLINVITTYSAGWTARNATGFNYQAVSYAAAIAFGIKVWFLKEGFSSTLKLHENREDVENGRLPRLYYFVSLLQLGLLFVLVFISGGRGGVILVGVYVLLAIYWYNSSLFSRVISIVLMVIIAMFVFQALGNSSLVNSFAGLNRVLFRGDNRSEVFDLAVAAISNKPLFGYGFGGYGKLLGGHPYPHNIILDIILCSGMFGFAVFVMIVVILCLGWRRMRSRYTSYARFLLIIALYSVVNLLFSGTYITSSSFWFFVGAVLSVTYLNHETKTISVKTVRAGE